MARPMRTGSGESLMDRVKPLVFVMMCGVLMAGCTVGPDYVEPDLEMPDAWHTAAVEGIESGEADLQTWWRVFDDPVLDELVELASRNTEIGNAAALVETHVIDADVAIVDQVARQLHPAPLVARRRRQMIHQGDVAQLGPHVRVVLASKAALA